MNSMQPSVRNGSRRAMTGGVEQETSWYLGQNRRLATRCKTRASMTPGSVDRARSADSALK